jgi:hypothetical protein
VIHRFPASRRRFFENLGRRPAGYVALGVAISNWLAHRIGSASQVSPSINATFLSVQQLVTPPSALFRPAFVAKSLWLSAVSRR